MRSERNGSWIAETRRAAVFVGGEWGVATTVVGLSLAVASVNAVEPLVFKQIFDGLVGPEGGRALAVGIVLLGLVGLSREALSGGANWLTWRLRLRVHERLLEATVGRIHALPAEFHREQTVGGLMTRLDRGISGFLGALQELAFNVMPAAVYLGISLVLMVRLDWRLSLVALAFAPVPAAIGAWAAREQTDRERKLLNRWSRIYSRFNEVLAGIGTVKSFVMEDAEQRRFLSRVRRANDVVIRGVRRDTGVGASQNLVAMTARLGVIGLGGALVLDGQATVGTVIAFLGYIGGLFGPVQGLTNAYQTVRKASVSLDVIFSILDAEDRVVDAPDARPLDSVRGAVEFEGVGFAYGEGPPLLEGIDVRAAPGEVIAIVGPSGAGKTTLMSLLQRFHDPTAGVIRVDGRDIRGVRQKSLRRHIAVVLQDALLFNDTVANNIAYGRPGAPRKEIEAAARAANAHEFVVRMEAGYDTVVGERGGRLSAGERQRIAIARALLKDAPILILDEATSALDAATEALVQEALDRLVRGRTTFVIAHRLSTVVAADRIVVLRHGRIVETGTHAELVAAGGFYAWLARLQSTSERKREPARTRR